MIDEVHCSSGRTRLHAQWCAVAFHCTAGRFVTRAAVIAGVLSLLGPLAGCTVGPEYHTPAPPATQNYTSTPLPDRTASSQGAAGLEQRFAAGGDLPAQWWTLYRCEQLNTLISEALKSSPTIAAASAALRQAAENLRAQAGTALYPSIDAKLNAMREKLNGATLGQPNVNKILTLYNASVSVSYDMDLFGGVRRELESLGAQVDFERFQLQGAYLALSANIVTAAVKEASLREQIGATENIVADEDAQLDVLRKQFEFGGVDRTAVLAQETLVAQTRATLPLLRQSLDRTRHQLAVLSGRLPSDTSVSEFTLSMFTLPQTLPVSLPSSLVRQRPDILAADAVLHQASAEVGVATANLYPQLILSANYGPQSLTPAGMLKYADMIWNIGAGLTQPIFHGGQLSAKKSAAEAAFDEANARYRQVVLLAFEDVADTLRALDHDADALAAQTEAWRAARSSLNLARGQFRVGGVSYLSLLDAQRQYQQAVVNLAQAQATRYSDTAALFQALGGGWWNDTAYDEKGHANDHPRFQ
ncbi:efflux transporter outer membrane subunit [Paraburkholderia mimosarum]|uniref:efflux transporter outer membrane subunit n=1 Tax=Paraburkholderia mimosarum TaxID=312026 RepID=UPI0003F9AB97|nr:efflux transporter outer membrane subunit [Paraburkholderia mimosarum]